MSKPIHPSTLREPFRLEEVVAVIDSWRGLPRGKVPRSVRLVAWALQGMVEAVAMAEEMRCDARGLERLLDRIHRISRVMPEDVPGYGHRFAVAEAHRQALGFMRSEKREAAERLARMLELLVTHETEQQAACAAGSVGATTSPPANGATAA